MTNEMSLLKSVNERDGQSGDVKEWAPPALKIGVWLFVGVVSSLFFLLTAAYNMRMQYPDWRPMPDPWMLWLNSAVLMLSSVALQWARINARRGRINNVKIGLLVGGALAFAFLAGQLWAWQYLKNLNYLVDDNPANSFFFLITGLHALHLAGGLFAWGGTAFKTWRGADARLNVELCALYWHFLFVVWIAMFALLLFADTGPRNWIPLIC